VGLFIFTKKIPPILRFNPVWSGYNLHAFCSLFATCTPYRNFVLEGADSTRKKLSGLKNGGSRGFVLWGDFFNWHFLWFVSFCY